ncbi:pantothenate synthase [Ceratobasidium sp. 370]|nr:pantothenate synthase [Ceratobasidium sp. 370]
MHALRIRRSLQLSRAIRIQTRGLASALPGYPVPGTAFSPPPAPSRTSESSASAQKAQPIPDKQRQVPGTAAPDFAPTVNKSPNTAALPKSDIPIFTTLAELRAWREKAFREGKSVGFVPTMGALHQGHVTLVRESLKENDLTVISIFVNPTQFAPHEDLATYPRTLESDVSLLSACSATPSNSSSIATLRTPSIIFLPSASELYPSGVSQSEQIGTYVLPSPTLASQMEGKSRPTFFRGVATVVTKLLNGVLPTHVYFGQKDIQQALLMRGMVKDLCMGVGVRIIRTVRENVMEGSSQAGPQEGLALSSRNAYLSSVERTVAPTLRRALGAVEAAWYAGAGREDALASGRAVVEAARQGNGVDVRLDYIEMNDPRTFEVIPNSLRAGVPERDSERAGGSKGPAVILSGALWVGKTRLIDNVLLGDAGWVFE